MPNIIRDSISMPSSPSSLEPTSSSSSSFSSTMVQGSRTTGSERKKLSHTEPVIRRRSHSAHMENHHTIISSDDRASTFRHQEVEPLEIPMMQKNSTIELASPPHQTYMYHNHSTNGQTTTTTAAAANEQYQSPIRLNRSDGHSNKIPEAGDDIYYLDNVLLYPEQDTPQKLEPPLYVGTDPARLKAYISAVHINLRAVQEKMKSMGQRERKLLEKFIRTEQQKQDLVTRCTSLQEQLHILQNHSGSDSQTLLLEQKQREVDHLIVELKKSRSHILELEHLVQKERDEQISLRKAFSDQHDHDMTQLSDSDMLIRSLKKELQRLKDNSNNGSLSGSARNSPARYTEVAFQQQLRQLQHQHEHQLYQVRQQAGQEIQQLQEQQESMIQRIRVEHEAVVQRLKNKHGMMLHQIQEEQNEKTNSLNQRNGELEKACARLQEQIAIERTARNNRSIVSSVHTQTDIQASRNPKMKNAYVQSQMTANSISVLEDTVGTLQNELKSHNSQTSLQLQDLEVKNHEMQQNAMRQQEQNTEIRNKYRSLHDRYKQLRQSRQMLEEEFEELRQRRAEDNESHKQRLSSVQQELQESTNRITQLQSQYNSLHAENESAKNQLTQRTVQMENAHRSSERILAERKELEKRCIELDAQLRQASQTLADESEAFKVQIQELEKRCRQEIDDAKKKYREEKELAITRTCEKMLRECDDQVGKLHTQIKQLQEQLSHESIQRGESQNEVRIAHEKLHTLRGEYESLQRSYEEMQRNLDKLDRYRNMIHQLKDRLARRKRDVERLTDRYENKLADAETQVHNLQAANTQFNQTMSLKDVQIQSLNRQIKQYQQYLKNHMTFSGNKSLSRSLFSISQDPDISVDSIYSQNLNNSLLQQQQQQERFKSNSVYRTNDRRSSLPMSVSTMASVSELEQNNK